MKNQIKYVSDIQPPYGISRYRYYEVLKDNDDYYITNDYDTKLYYFEDRFKELFSNDDWNSIFVKENIILNNTKKVEKVKKTISNRNDDNDKVEDSSQEDKMIK